MMASQFIFHILVLMLIIHLMVSPCSTSMQPLCHNQEGSFLLQFKNSLATDKLASTNPLAYSKVELWTKKGETIDCCFWDGIECNENTGYVISLDLSSSYLYGSVNSNSSLFKLVHLEKLNLADNHFNYSQIPHAINQLSSLTHLNLSYCFFSGQVPSEISGLTKLVSLDLSGNTDKHNKLASLDFMAYPIPHAINQLSNLKHLNLSVEMPLKLKRLDFKSLIVNLTSLEQLSLSYVDISGDLHSSIGNLTSLNKLDFAGCKFSGVIPIAIVNLNRLNYLDLSENDFKGQIPSFLSNLNHLTYLDLSSNNFNRGILSWIGNLTKLTHLNIGYSNLTGIIPNSLGNLTQLTKLMLEENQLYGRIPYSFSRLKNLQTLFLRGNDLSGLVSFEMFLDMKNLNQFSLSDNRLSVITKPRSNINASLPQFIGLGLGSCHLKEFPEFLRYQETMEWLNLAGNKISGEIPKWLWNTNINTLVSFNLMENCLTGFEQPPIILPWLSIRIFQLSHNMLTGPLPIPPLSTFIYDASNNDITGEISPLVCKLQKLQVLHLFNNKLSGTIPGCLGNFSNSLRLLNLRNNSFSGEIPQTFTDRNQLWLIDLSYNNLEGSLPRSLVNCKMLQILNLRNNKLKDVFPSWLGTLPELQILILQFNRLYGEIGMPAKKLEFPKLCIIDLSYNNFTGKLPSKYIQSWNAMKNKSVSNVLTYLKIYTRFGIKAKNNFVYIFQYFFVSITIANKGGNLNYGRVQDVLAVLDLSSNNFEGEIPAAIGNLKGLQALNLSNNILVGDIPLSLGNLTELESLDLSKNKLSGHIPEQLQKLTFLSYFNVSHNNLTGPIPQGNQFSIFENTSYAGNLGLCGDPLTKRCGNSEYSRPPSFTSEEDHHDSGSVFEFGWKPVLIGYASGLVVGLVIGQIVISRKQRWFAMNFRVRLSTRRNIRTMRRGNLT